jgi:tRNA (mo5U34)-methyltransferase
MNDKGLQQEVDALRWFFQLDFGNGVLSPGVVKADKIRRMERAIFTPLLPLKGKTVLDVGCWDGAYSIAASRLGAARVLATDHYVWHDGPGDRRAFDLARKHLAPDIEDMDIAVEDLTEERVGRFDVVLFLGVFYHLRHPFAALEQIAALAKEVLVVESRMTQLFNPRPVMQFHPGGSLEGDPTNWWTPNRACMAALLADIGFREVRFLRPDRRFRRGMFHAFR